MSEFQKYIRSSKLSIALMERRLVQQELVISRLALVGKSTENAEDLLLKLEASIQRSRHYLWRLETASKKAAFEYGGAPYEAFSAIKR